MVEKHKLGFDILHDPGNVYAAKQGLRFELPDDLRAVYLKLPIDLPGVNGEPSWTLAIPTRVLVSSDGVVRAVHADPDYTRRPEPQTSLNDIALLG